jgi:hypothetical protein
MSYAMKYILVILVLFLAGCGYDDESCRAYHVGEFFIDTTVIHNSFEKKIVLERKWDTVKLVSQKNGHYFFNTKDKILKSAEGSWQTRSNNIEGQCSWFLQQNNLTMELNQYEFDILILLNDTIRFSLPFRRKKL